jgi:hypothetical protein
MLNFAKVCCLCVAMALILAFISAPADAFLSTNCVTADRGDASLLLQIKKQKKHKDGQSQNDAGLTECTIQQPGSGGGCKAGLKWVCEKMKSGKKCCGCVADKSAKQAPAGQGGENKDDWLYEKLDQPDAAPQQAPTQGGENKDDWLYQKLDQPDTAPQQ